MLSQGPIIVDPADGSVEIPGVQFKTAYSLAKIDTGSVFKIKYVSERYEWFNVHLFGHSLKTPAFVIGKNSKILGSWSPSKRELMTSSKMFDLKVDKHVLGTIVHEMAHQYESDHEPRQPMEYKLADRGSHGPTWQNIMRRIGLPVDAKFVGDAVDLQTFSQRKAVERLGIQGITPEYLKTANEKPKYGVHVNPKTGKATPVMLTGHLDEHGRVAGFPAKLVHKTTFLWLKLEEIYAPSVNQLQKFPHELLDTWAHNRWQDIVDHLNSKGYNHGITASVRFKAKSQGRRQHRMERW